MALKISTRGNQIVFTNTETNEDHSYSSVMVEAVYGEDSMYFIHQLGLHVDTYPFGFVSDSETTVTKNEQGRIVYAYADIQDEDGNELSTRSATQSYLSKRLGDNAYSAMIAEDYTHQVAKGKIPNAALWNKFGYNLDVDSGGEEIIASWGGAFDPTTDIMSTLQTFTIAYNSGTDGEGTTGALSLLIYYLDTDFNEAIAFHTLGSTGTDVTSFSGYGINRCVVYTNGGSGYNVNDITVTATTDTTVQAQIPALESTTQQAIFHTAVGYQFAADWSLVNVRKLSGGSAPRVTIKAYSWSRVTSTRYEVFRLDVDTSIENSIALTPKSPFPIGGREVLYWTASTNTNDTIVNLRFSGIHSKLN